VWDADTLRNQRYLLGLKRATVHPARRHRYGIFGQVKIKAMRKYVMCYANRCRARAVACFDLAHSVEDAQQQSTLFEIAQSWTKLASNWNVA